MTKKKLSLFPYVLALGAVALISALVLSDPKVSTAPATPRANTPVELTLVTQNQEAAVVSPSIEATTITTATIATTTTTSLLSYVEIIGGCGPYYNVGACVNLRSGPGTEFPVVSRLRTGIVLRVESDKVVALDGSPWHKIVFDKGIRYPERIAGDWYVTASSTLVRSVENVGDIFSPVGTTASTSKRVVVSLSEGMLYAYDGKELFMKEPTSPGLDLTPTPRGLFTVYYKTPSRYMQGPIPGISDQEYDLPGVPWNLYFTAEGAVIHGAYWHDNFGKKWSHGCVNLSPESAKKIYEWAEIGMPVIVRD